MHTSRMNIELETKLFNSFESAVKERGLTKAFVIRNLVWGYLRDLESHPTGQYFVSTQPEVIRRGNGGTKKVSK